jgi:hypothetical protein
LFYGTGDGPIILATLKKKVNGTYKTFLMNKEVLPFFLPLILSFLFSSFLLNSSIFQGFDLFDINASDFDRIPEKIADRKVQLYFEQEYKCTLQKGEKLLSSAILKLEEEDPQVSHPSSSPFTRLFILILAPMNPPSHSLLLLLSAENKMCDLWSCICRERTKRRERNICKS